MQISIMKWMSNIRLISIADKQSIIIFLLIYYTNSKMQAYSQNLFINLDILST